jgi:alpha-D-ribose 1-methylphosphonate 5-triphosphate synthase subunit PhnH
MIGSLALEGVSPGFANPVADSQRVFRRVLDAMSRPGRLIDLDSGIAAASPHLTAASALALTLLDFETPVFVALDADGEAFANWLRFHCGCPITVEPKAAAYALVLADLLPALGQFYAGDPKYPDRATTLIVVCAALEGGAAVRLEGPGIAETRRIAPSGLPEDFWNQVRADRSAFQLGVDIILTAGDQIIALPRSTRIVPEN